MLRCGVKFYYEDFISAKHRDGGVSHIKKTRSEERKDKYHQDLLEVIKNEILLNYKFADESLQKKIYCYANDRKVISEFRLNFFRMSFIQKVQWMIKNKNLLTIFTRGCLRKFEVTTKKVMKK